MGERPDQIDPTPMYSRDPAADVSPSDVDTTDVTPETEAIRSDIEQTRANMTETINALQEKLSPDRIAEQVKDKVREQAVETFDTMKENVKQAAVGKAEKVMTNVSDTVTDLSRRTGVAPAVDYMRDNPIAWALIGAGVSMLLFGNRRGNGSTQRYNSYGPSADYATDRTYGSYEATYAPPGQGGSGENRTGSARKLASKAAERASSTASSVRGTASNVAEKAGSQVQYARQQMRQGAQYASGTFEQNPLVLGIAALAAGAVAGLVIPATQVEREYMGQASEQMIESAKSMARDTVDKVQRVAQELPRTVTEEAKKQGLTGGGQQGSGEPNSGVQLHAPDFIKVQD